MYATDQTLTVIERWFAAQGCNVEHGVLSGNVIVDLRSLANVLEIEKCLATIPDTQKWMKRASDYEAALREIVRRFDYTISSDIAKRTLDNVPMADKSK